MCSVSLLAREAIDSRLPDIARLRIHVFREWPYLYDGDEAYERQYLKRFAESPRAALVIVEDNGLIVGASTAAPLADHDGEFSAPFETAGLDLNDYFYFGESVLLPEYRGRGIGVKFFELREQAARAERFRYTTFCGVIRPADHPARPHGYVPLDGFWTRRGYTLMPGLTANYAWKEVGDAEETPHPMQFWSKHLDETLPGKRGT